MEQPKRGRKPKLTDAQICAFFVVSAIFSIPVMTLIKVLGLDIHSWHVFRKYRLKRVYRCLREFLKELNKRTQNRQVLIVDGKLLPTSRLERALTQRIKRGFGKKSWGRRKRKLYSVHKKEKIEIDTLVYGVLIMAVVDEMGRIADRGYRGVDEVEICKSKEQN